MAPAVSWKSSSCCRNRMACRREVKVSIASAYSLNRALSAVPMETTWIPRDGQTAESLWKGVEFELQTEQINPAVCLLTLLVSSWTVPSLGMLYSLSGSFCGYTQSSVIKLLNQ